MFICTGITPSVAVDNIEQSSMPTSNGKTLYVGGTGFSNYTKIKDAINHANPGDTVFVYDESSPYYENIKINRPINLIGEDRNSTIIDGRGRDDVVYISADWINISGFTLQNGGPIYMCFNGYGIIIRGDNNTIKDNKISNNKFGGIDLEKSIGNTIKDNIITNNDNGIDLEKSIGNTITGNNFLNDNLVLRDSSNYNIISDNSFFNNGLNILDSYQNIVTNNIVNDKLLVYLEDKSDITIDNAGQVILINCNNITIRNQEISHTNIAIRLYFTHNCRIYHNTISNNVYGINLHESNFNIIQKNNFWGNRLFNACFTDSWINRWKQNYWNRPRILPKLITGVNEFGEDNLIFWINVDWRPARLPNKI